MSGFDFRDLMGGAAGKVTDDAELADGAAADRALGLCAHMLAKRDGVPALLDHFARSIIWTANANGMCTGALTALIVERLLEIAAAETADQGEQRTHLAHEVLTRVEAVFSKAEPHGTL